jgi:WD40 repeat protein
VAVSRDGQLVASVGDDNSLRLWDATTLTELRRRSGRLGQVRSVAIAPHGNWIAAGGDDATIRIWDAHTGALRHSLTGHTDVVRALTVSPDGSRIVSVSDDASIRIWDDRSPKTPELIRGHVRPVWAVAVDERGESYATGGDGATVRVWQFGSGDVAPPREHHAAGVLSIAISRVGRRAWIYSASKDGVVGVAPLDGKGVSYRRRAHDTAIRSVCVGPDGKWLATSGDDGNVKIWRLGGSGHIISHLATLTGHLGPVWCLSASSDGLFVASGGSDGTVRIWDLDGGSVRHVFRGHVGGVRSVDVSPEDGWVASGGVDGTVRIWDIATGSQIAALLPVPGDGWSAFLSDGRYKLDGRPQSVFWFAKGLECIAPGELIEATAGIQRIRGDAPIWARPS